MELHANAMHKQKILKPSVQPQSVRGHQPVPFGVGEVKAVGVAGEGGGDVPSLWHLGLHCVTPGWGSSCESGCRCSCLGGPSGWKQPQTQPATLTLTGCGNPTSSPPPSPASQPHTHSAVSFCASFYFYIPPTFHLGSCCTFTLIPEQRQSPQGNRSGCCIIQKKLNKEKKKWRFHTGVVSEFMRLHLAHSESVARPSCRGEKVTAEMTASTSRKEKTSSSFIRRKKPPPQKNSLQS